MADEDRLAAFPPFQQNDSAIDSVIAHWRRQREYAFRAATANEMLRTNAHTAAFLETVKIPAQSPEKAEPAHVAMPSILLQAVVTFADKTSEGRLVETVAIPWFEIIRQLERDPEFLFKVPWRKLEEIIAGAYEREGYPEVILTPRSGDGGRDVIASRPGVGSIRIFDQVKAYRASHLVTADEVNSMLGVLTRDSNVSKGLVTTTSDFAPWLRDDESLKRLMPYRLELKNGKQLRDWLIGLVQREHTPFGVDS